MSKVIISIIVLVVLASIGYFAYRAHYYRYPLPKTATSVSLQKYSGNWYEIALFPNRFEKGCSCTEVNYSLDGQYVKVKNSCYKKAEQKTTTVQGKAWPVDESNSKLKVQFMWPFRGDYWILYVDKNYQYALVGGPTRQYLWIIARTKKIPVGEYQKLVSIAKDQGFDVSKLIKAVHDCS